MGLHIIQMSKYITTGIAFLFAAAILIFILPLLVMFIIKYAQRYESLKWLIDLNTTDARATMKMNFIPL